MYVCLGVATPSDLTELNRATDSPAPLLTDSPAPLLTPARVEPLLALSLISCRCCLAFAFSLLQADKEHARISQVASQVKGDPRRESTLVWFFVL